MIKHNLDLSLFDEDEIISIEFDKIDECIDIVVEDTHMFFANGIYTHNSGFNAEINDEQTIGKAIEPFQVADVVLTYSQPKNMLSSNKCYVVLLKNRLGKKGICLECSYDPNMCTFQELQVVNDMLLLDSGAKRQIQATIQNHREKLQKIKV